MQLYVGVLYFQSGLSKLLDGGVGWFTSGDTVYALMVYQDIPLAQPLLQHRWLFSVAGVCVGLLEFFFLPLLLLRPRLRPWLGGAAALFHLVLYLTVKISFWHLAVLIPFLFIAPAHLRHRPR
jgi:hypothetical protein